MSNSLFNKATQIINQPSEKVIIDLTITPTSPIKSASPYANTKSITDLFGNQLASLQPISPENILLQANPMYKADSTCNIYMGQANVNNQTNKDRFHNLQEKFSAVSCTFSPVDAKTAAYCAFFPSNTPTHVRLIYSLECVIEYLAENILPLDNFKTTAFFLHLKSRPLLNLMKNIVNSETLDIPHSREYEETFETFERLFTFAGNITFVLEEENTSVGNLTINYADQADLRAIEILGGGIISNLKDLNRKDIGKHVDTFIDAYPRLEKYDD